VVVCKGKQRSRGVAWGLRLSITPTPNAGVLPLTGPLLGLVGSSGSFPLSAGLSGRLVPPSDSVGVDIVTAFQIRI
jgi:hypothetical protein